MNAPVGVPKAFNRQNENAFRQYAEGELALCYRKDTDIIIPFGFALGFTGANGEEVRFVLDGSGAFTLTVDGVEIINIDADSATFALNGDGRVVGLRLTGGATTTIDMLASALNFYDGITDRPLLTAAAGRFTVNGDLVVSGSITVGAVRWPVSLQPKSFFKADGETIQWASGAALNAVPDVQITVPAGVALAAGEAWDTPVITGATTTGGTLYLKISTPGATSTVTDTTDAAGGGANPDRVMEKADSADAYNGLYYFRIQGTMAVTSYAVTDPTGFLHTGSVELSPWFNEGGGWDEAPTIVLSPSDIGIGDFGASDLTGSQSFDVTVPVLWTDPIGQHGSYEWGVSHESGGALTDFVSVQYVKQSTSGTRTGSPNGETATIIVRPKNQ